MDAMNIQDEMDRLNDTKMQGLPTGFYDYFAS